ncbi:carbohydrate ABC transporter permease, partial [Microbacterium sp. p3-SID336]|uniref:carbohydrate ABC transporter permease n=1 Tax=Microbacterium sp. p3-SID336 TaxID=2916212 RepID=UPI0021A7930A
PRRRTPGASPWWALVFLGPTALGLAVFYLWPTVRTLLISFTKTGPFGGSEWVGWENYARLFQEPELLGALRNTAIYTVIALIGIPIAVAIAALLNTAGLKGRSAYRTLYFIPVVTMPAAIALVWRMIYNGDYGVLNAALGAVGIEGRSWLTDPNTALVAIAVVGIWAGLGTNIVIFLAGLQGIPDTIMEAADLDGAGPVRKFFSITIPLLSPSIFFVSVISVIGALQVFDLIYMMLGRSNPAMPNTRTVVYLFYEAGFLDNDRGYAAAVAFLLLLIILVLTVVQFRLQKKWVHYE